MRPGFVLAGLLGLAFMLTVQLLQLRGDLPEVTWPTLSAAFLGSPPAPSTTALNTPPPATSRRASMEVPLPPGVKGNLAPDEQVEFAEMPPLRPFKLITKGGVARRKPRKMEKAME